MTILRSVSSYDMMICDMYEYVCVCMHAHAGSMLYLNNVHIKWIYGMCRNTSSYRIHCMLLVVVYVYVIAWLSFSLYFYGCNSCYTLTACSDPGIVFRPPEDEDDEDEEGIETGAEERTEEGRVTDPQADLSGPASTYVPVMCTRIYATYPVNCIFQIT